jgi:N-acetylglucosamine kinase-like BadF-type ATPase
MTYLVGIDSGGSRTNIRVLGPEDKRWDLPEIPSSTSSARSDTEIRETFKQIFSAIEARTMGSEASAWLSAAGYSLPSQKRIEGLLQEFLGGFNGTLGISNDAVTLLLAHDQGTVVLVIGTGSAAMARRSNGHVLHIGGQEWVASDYGSGFWIGLNGIRAAYKSLEGGPETSLKPRLLDNYRGVFATEEKDPDAIILEIVRLLAGSGFDLKRQIASFARPVCDVAERSDEVAQGIVREAALENATAAAELYRRLVGQQGDGLSPKVLISGSVAYGSTFFREAFQFYIDSLLSDIRSGLKLDKVEVVCVPDGVDEALSLARSLSVSESLASLDDRHPVKVFA